MIVPKDRMDDPVILLVEDDENDVEMTLRAFRRSRISNRVVVASDGVAALEYLFARGAYADRRADERPHLILLDLRLPKLDGLGVLSAVRADERTRLIPVVLLTSSAEEEARIASYGLGTNRFVRKPVDFFELSRAVVELGLYWLVLNEAP